MAELEEETQPLLQRPQGPGGGIELPPREGRLAEDVAAQMPPPFGPAALAYHLLSIVTALSALACCAAVATLAAATALLSWAHFWRMALQCYSVALALLVALLELPRAAPLIASCCQALDWWVARGLLQFLVALLAHDEVAYQVERAQEQGDTPGALSPVVGFAVLAGNSGLLLLSFCAAVHVVGGLLCAGRAKEYVLEKRRRHQHLLGELQELERLKADLRQGLLQPQQFQSV